MKHRGYMEIIIMSILFRLIINIKNYFINITGYVSLLAITCAGKDYLLLTHIDG